MVKSDLAFKRGYHICGTALEEYVVGIRKKEDEIIEYVIKFCQKCDSYLYYSEDKKIESKDLKVITGYIISNFFKEKKLH
jgi:hypothetical protein